MRSANILRALMIGIVSLSIFGQAPEGSPKLTSGAEKDVYVIATRKTNLTETTRILEAYLRQSGVSTPATRYDVGIIGADINFQAALPTRKASPINQFSSVPFEATPTPNPSPVPSSPPPAPIGPKPPDPAPLPPGTPPTMPRPPGLTLERYRIAVEAFRHKAEGQRETGDLHLDQYIDAIAEYRREISLYKQTTKLVKPEVLK